MKYQIVRLSKRFDANARYGQGAFIGQLFLLDIEFSEQGYLDRNPCPCSRGRDSSVHEFISKPTGLFLKCKVQNVVSGLIPDVPLGSIDPYGWVTLQKVKPISNYEAREIFASKKLVASPDVVIHLLRS